MALWFARLCLGLVAGFVGALHAAPTLQAEAAASRRADLAALQSDLESIRREAGVPALGVGGMFLTSPSKAGIRGQSEQLQGKQAIAVADHLINLARQRKG